MDDAAGITIRRDKNDAIAIPTDHDATGDRAVGSTDRSGRDGGRRCLRDVCEGRGSRLWHKPGQGNPACLLRAAGRANVLLRSRLERRDTGEVEFCIDSRPAHLTAAGDAYGGTGWRPSETHPHSLVAGDCAESRALVTCVLGISPIVAAGSREAGVLRGLRI